MTRYLTDVQAIAEAMHLSKYACEASTPDEMYRLVMLHKDEMTDKEAHEPEYIETQVGQNAVAMPTVYHTHDYAHAIGMRVRGVVIALHREDVRVLDLLHRTACKINDLHARRWTRYDMEEVVTRATEYLNEVRYWPHDNARKVAVQFYKQHYQHGIG